MRKNRTIITESQLHRIVKESVKRILKENDDLGDYDDYEDYDDYLEVIEVAYDINNGMPIEVVRGGGEENLVLPNGDLISPNKWFGSCNFIADGFMMVRLNDKQYFIKPDGTLVPPYTDTEGCIRRQPTIDLTNGTEPPKRKNRKPYPIKPHR